MYHLGFFLVFKHIHVEYVLFTKRREMCDCLLYLVECFAANVAYRLHGEKRIRPPFCETFNRGLEQAASLICIWDTGFVNNCKGVLKSKRCQR